MSRLDHNYQRRGCSIGAEVTVTGNAFTPVEIEELQAVIRFWKRRVAYSIRHIETVNGEADFEIDVAHLTYALGRIHHYETMLAKTQPATLEPK
jgi:hypothetical protein